MDLYHCVRGIQLGVPGANKSIGPLQTAALADVPYMPWLNMGHCVRNTTASPLVPDPDRMRNYIENVVLDEAGYPISKFMYLDIEGVLHPERPWFPGQGNTVRDCLIIAKSVLHWRGQHRCRVFVWDSLAGSFKRGRHPDYTGHALTDPYCDALYLSMYGFTDDPDWRTVLNLDMQWATRYADFYSETYCHGRPRVFFVWGWHGDKGFYPLDIWQAWLEFLVTLMRPGDVMCWFGAAHAHKQVLDDHYGPQIETLKAVLGA